MESIKKIEKRPVWRGSFQYIINKLGELKRGSDDMTDVWRAITPDIKEIMAYTFSDANPNKWSKLTAKYRNWKIKHGYPATIGILTGALKKSLVDDPDIKLLKQKMIYKYNENITGYGGKKTSDFAEYFNAKRNVMSYPRVKLNEIIKRAAKAHVRKHTKWGTV